MANVTVTRDRCTAEPLYQWDTEQVLEIRGLSLSVAPEVHFSRTGDTEATVRRTTMDAGGVVRVEVPDEFLERAGVLRAYVCIKEGSAFCTLFTIPIPVKRRETPCDCSGRNEVL